MKILLPALLLPLLPLAAHAQTQPLTTEIFGAPQAPERITVTLNTGYRLATFAGHQPESLSQRYIYACDGAACSCAYNPDGLLKHTTGDFVSCPPKLLLNRNLYLQGSATAANTTFQPAIKDIQK